MFTRDAELPAPQAGRDDDRDRLKLFAAAQHHAFGFQVHAGNLDLSPEIKITIFSLGDEPIAQLAAAVSMQAEIVVDGIVNREKLPADFFTLFQYQRIET